MRAKKIRKHRVTNMKSGKSVDVITAKEAIEFAGGNYHTEKKYTGAILGQKKPYKLNGFKIERVWIVQEK